MQAYLLIGAGGAMARYGLSVTGHFWRAPFPYATLPFSAFSLDAIALIERGAGGRSVVYALLSVIVSVVALFLDLLMMSVSL